MVGAALVAGIFLGILIRKRMLESNIKSAQTQSELIISGAQKEAETVLKEAKIQAKDSLYQMKQEVERETKERRAELQSLEKRLVQKEDNLEKKLSVVDSRESELSKRENEIVQREHQAKDLELMYEDLVAKQKQHLERLAGITSEEARDMLIQQMEQEARHEAAKKIKRIEAETKEISDKKAKEIIALAIKRYSGDYVAEKTVSVVNLPSDDMKGRIIGREGRNIRAIEAATGIDLIIDDTPEAVILSGFNPIRREIAKLSLERLINDGRIHPARIEEVVEKVTQEMEVSLREAGEQATFDVGVHGIHPELIKLIGKLKYRSSYGQNVLQHSIEVAFLCGIMASELNLNAKQAKRAGLLHDIGKAVDHEVEGPHALIGADLAKKYNESNKVIHSIAAHHEDVPPESVLAVLVQTADTLSGARPGARREMLETYIKRLEDLEKIAKSFPGVGKTYAIQAGRELRIIVSSDDISDEESVLLCSDVARKIESELIYPGQIRVTVIRETRAVDYAR
ncbi:MAG: ribonuclease Y [Deltaproteobacteria bacterium]|nr:ribonuclease Y [Deltaproteobacteria bacterium]